MGTSIDSEGKVLMTCPPQVILKRDITGLKIIGLEGQMITLMADESILTVTPEIIEIETPDVNITCEAAVEIEATDLNVSTAATEVETGDMRVASGAVEVEAGLFTVV